MTENYKELGGVHKKVRFYAEGEEYTHPSGNVYKRINGNWVLQPKKNHENNPA